MKIRSGLIHKTTGWPGMVSLTILVEGDFKFTPGQYLAANLEGDLSAAAPLIFYIESQNGREVNLCPAPLEGWHPGRKLNYRGPLGRGITFPAHARRMALVSLDNSPARLSSFVAFGLENRLDIAMCGDWATQPQVSALIPPSVELAELSRLPEMIEWADYCLIDLPASKMAALSVIVQANPRLLLPGTCQVLIHAPMPCAGIAECGICAVSTRQGYKHACTDGPVFDLPVLKL